MRTIKDIREQFSSTNICYSDVVKVQDNNMYNYLYTVREIMNLDLKKCPHVFRL